MSFLRSNEKVLRFYTQEQTEEINQENADEESRELRLNVSEYLDRQHALVCDEIESMLRQKQFTGSFGGQRWKIEDLDRREAALWNALEIVRRIS